MVICEDAIRKRRPDILFYGEECLEKFGKDTEKSP